MKVHELALILTKCPPMADVWVESEHLDGMDPYVQILGGGRVIEIKGQEGDGYGRRRLPGTRPLLRGEIDPTTWTKADKSDEKIKGSANPPCQYCYGPHRFDTSIPSVTWNRVIRAAGLPDYLCVSCIVEEFAKIQEGFTAELSGEQLNKVPVEFRIGGEAAKDAADLSAENTKLRATISEIATFAEKRLTEIIRGR